MTATDREVLTEEPPGQYEEKSESRGVVTVSGKLK